MKRPLANAACALLVLLTAPVAAAAEEAALAAEGKALFEARQCSRCHTFGTPAQPDKHSLDQFRPSPDPLLLGAELWRHAPALFEAGAAEAQPLPTLEPGDVAKLWSYLNAGDAVPKGEYFTDLDEETGHKLFVAKCSACHRVRGEGGEIGPDLSEALRPVESRADIAALMWNHVPAMLAALRDKQLQVPTLEPREMAELFGFLLASVEQGFLNFNLGDPLETRPKQPEP